MFKEWKAIFKKPTFIIVMIGISLIPALYNIIFLSSMWLWNIIFQIWNRIFFKDPILIRG